MKKTRNTSDHDGQRAKKYKKFEKTLSQADFPKNPVISFSVLRAIKSPEIVRFQDFFLAFCGSNSSEKKSTNSQKTV